MASTQVVSGNKHSNIAKQSVPNCPVCESDKRRQLFLVQEHEYSNTTDDKFPLMECMNCTAQYLDPRPHESTLDIIYPKNYYAYVLHTNDPESLEASRKSIINRLAKIFFRRRLAPIARHVPLNDETRWLEVGCGNGAGMEWLLEVFGIKAVGLDYSEKAVEFCKRRGFTAHASRFEDFSPPPGSAFDVVYSSHVIEHVESPRQYVRKSFDLLREGGLCVFVTPNTHTWEARFFGKDWGGLHVPRHWCLLNPASSRVLAQENGFELLLTGFSANSTFWLWSFHSWLQGRISQNLNDLLFPSDHRFCNSGVYTLFLAVFFTLFDMANVRIFGRSANMLVVMRKKATASKAP